MTASAGPPCPLCGQPLTELPTPGRDTPPWACEIDARGWWNDELSAAARAAFRPEQRDFGVGPPAAAVQTAVAAERSARPEEQ